MAFPFCFTDGFMAIAASSRATEGQGLVYCCRRSVTAALLPVPLSRPHPHPHTSILPSATTTSLAQPLPYRSPPPFVSHSPRPRPPSSCSSGIQSKATAEGRSPVPTL